MEQPDLFGTDPKFLVRTHDPETSHEAADSVNSTRLEREVYETIIGFGQAYPLDTHSN